MAIKRRRYDAASSQAAGLDYLLRRTDRLTTEPLSNAQAKGGYVFTGPIEPSFLVASVDARPQIRAVSDFICDGVNDEEEIQYALDQLPSTGGLVRLSAGRFYPGNASALVQIILPNYSWLQGSGEHITQFDSNRYAAAYDFQILYGYYCTLSGFSIVETGGL